MNLVRYVLLASALVISACGGGGGGGPEVSAIGDTSISATPTVLTFSSESGEALPAAQNVYVTYEGAGLLVGYPPDEPAPDWIQIVDHGGTTGSHTLGVYVSSEPPVAPGQRSATLRIVTALADGSKVKHADIAVTQNVLATTFTGSATPSSLSFLATSGGALPPAQQAEIQLSDGQITGVASNVPWLSVARAGTTLTATIASTADAPSTRDGMIVVYITRASGSVRQVVVPVSFTLGPAMVLNPTVLAFEAAAGDSAAPTPDTRSFTIDGSNLDWKASSSQGWLVLGQTSGTAPGTIGFTIDHSGLPGGEHSATISVHDAFSDRTRTIAVTLLVKAAQLVVSPPQASFVIDAASTASDLAQAVSVGDDAVGDDPISWSVTSVSAPWLEATPASGGSRPAAELTLSLDTSQLAALENGVHEATVSLGYTDAAGTPQTRAVNVQLDLSVPHADAVMPYLGIAGVARTVVLYGEGFEGLSIGEVTVGGVAPDSLEVLSDTAMRLGLPAFAAGTYDVDIVTPVGDFSDTGITVVPAQDRPYAVFDVHGFSGTVLFDNERETLYTVDYWLEEVERRQHVAGAWVELAPIEIEDVKDIELSRDGKTLYILANHAIHGLDLDDPLASPVLLHTDAGTVYHSIANHYWQLAIAGDNHALITSSEGVYPLEWQPGSPTVTLVQPQLGYTKHALMVVPADGSAIHVSGSDEQRYLAATGQLALVPGFGGITAANADGSRLLNLNAVYDQDYALVGKVRAGWVFSAYGRRNDRIYAIRADQQDYTGLGRYVYAVDPTGTPDADNVFPEVRRIEIPVADMPTVYPYTDRVPATVSADNRTFFFHGEDKLIIVPTGD